MYRRTLLGLTTAALLCTGVVFSASQAPAQKSLKDQLTGAWTLVSIDNTSKDGKKMQPFGPSPKGILVFDASGRYVQAQARTGRAKFKSNNRMVASADESMATLRDTLAIFGSWSVDEKSKTIVLRIESHIVPNTEGTEAKRMVTSITADELRYTNLGPGLGGTNESVYRRAK